MSWLRRPLDAWLLRLGRLSVVLRMHVWLTLGLYCAWLLSTFVAESSPVVEWLTLAWVVSGLLAGLVVYFGIIAFSVTLVIAFGYGDASNQAAELISTPLRLLIFGVLGTLFAWLLLLQDSIIDRIRRRASARIHRT